MKTDNYNPKLKLVDKNNIQHIIPNKIVTYSGNVNLTLYGPKKDPDICNKHLPLAAAVLGLDNTDAPLPIDEHFYHTWTDIDSQELYLNSKPMCYLILSKPGTGAYSLGENMAKKLNLVHLSPKNVIVDEIEQGSITGRSIDFNIRHNNVCKYDSIIKIMKTKLESPVIKHRGYVISGLPLVTSNISMQYFNKSLHEEDSILIAEDLCNDLIMNVHKKKGKKNLQDISSQGSDMVEAESDIEEEQEQELEAEEATEQIVALPKFILDPCSGILLLQKSIMNSKQTVLLHQCQELFNCNLKPDIIIFITCPDADAITKKNRKYFNYAVSSNPMGSYPFLTRNESEIRWPNKYGVFDNILNTIDISLLNRKYCCRLPINFNSNSTNQMCNYKTFVRPFIEKKVKDFPSNLILKLDGRNPSHEMLNSLLDKLLLLPVKPILLPEPLYLEEPSEDIEDFWKLAEEMNVIKCGVQRFGRFASPWYNRCPVELKKRHVMQGFSKYAVAFFNRIYLLSSLDSMVAFCRNPRPFLKLQFLKPTCRIIVMGTKSSGKSMISQCLSWLFNSSVICYNDFVDNIKKDKYEAFCKSISSEIIAKVESERVTKWTTEEQDRITNLNTWISAISKLLNRYIHLSKQYSSMIEQEIYDDNKSKEISKEINKLREDLCTLPFLDDIDICANVLKGHSLSQYAPLDFTTDIPKPALPVLGDDDVTIAISNYILEKNLEKDIEPTAAEIMEEMNSKLSDLDLENTEQSKWDYKYGKYIIDGFPVDMEIWDFLFGSPLLLPDYVITIIEDREIDEEIAEHYINLDICPKSHDTRFRLANDGLIKTKLLSENPSETRSINSTTITQDLINGIIQLIFINKSEVLNNLNESFNKFREDWENLKVNIKETSKACIEVQIENKSDIEILEEVLLKIRTSYSPPGNTDVGEIIEDYGSEESLSNDPLIANDPRFLCETNIYCPISYHKYGVLWEGKTEFCLKYDNKLHYFCKEEFVNEFQNDVTKYQTYKNPLKKVPPLKLCVIGSIGSGKTSAAKLLAKEYGLIHIDMVEFINYYLLPRHYKKVGRQYENSFNDTPIEEDTMVEINMNEDNLNLELDILSNESELRRIIYNYLEKGIPIVPVLMQKLIRKLWFETPFSSTGFVLDGFPKMQSDVEDMIECFCIPDLIIELECNSEVSSQRLTPKMFNTWKNQLNEAKIRSRIKLDNEKLQWRNFITEKVVISLIIDEIIGNVVIEPIETFKNISEQSAIIEADPLGLSNVDANLFNIYNDLILEFPEPIDTNEWENPDEVRERIGYRIESIYEIEDENIQSLKDTLTEQNIKSISVDGTKTFEKVGRVLLSKVASLRLKRERCFEQTFIIDLDVAEMLLLEGLFFLSKFYRMCPVYMYDNPDAICNPFNISKTYNKITSVIHRSHIFFICNKDNVKKFRENPLKYILNDNIKYFYSYPLRFAVLGPPKSGKSELTAKLAKKYGLICVSKGIALRYVVSNLSWTDLALKIISKLQKGESICNYTVIEAVQTVINNHCSASRGFVLDGLPSSPFEAMELQKRGLFPLNIFDIRADKHVILKNSQLEIYPNIIKRKPPYPRHFIAYRFSKYIKECDRVKEYVNNDTQNMYDVSGRLSRWKCFYEADNVISKIIPQIHYYLTNYNSKIVPVAAMCISDDDFQLKMSKYKNFCPICLHKNVIKHSGFPVDKKGVVQFKENFYWVCREHSDLLLKDPTQVLDQNVDIPEIPSVVKTINHCNLYEDGVCIVTYAENLPAQFIEKGNENFAAVYKDKTYLFCKLSCLQKFLATPQMFYDITVFKECKIFPQILLTKLPHLGYLEQTVGHVITEACCSVNVVRPKYPGLTIQISALLFIALYLKIHNPLTKASHLPLYIKALKTFERRCQLVTSVGLRLRAVDNPFANYPKCCNVSDGTKESDSGTVEKPSSFKIESNLSLDCLFDTARRVPVPDERFDYLCEYHKPASKVPAFLNVVDIAGLVRGAAEGQGLGNAFLSHIKACDAIFNLCRAFDDEDVIHVDGDVNPVRDLETIGEELRLKDEEQLMQNIDKLERVVNRGGDKKLKPEYDALMKIKSILVEEKKHIRFGDWSAAEIEILNRYLFLTSKPALYLVNLSEKDYIRKKNKWLPKLKEWIDKNDPGAPLIPFSGVFESKLMDMEPPERQAYLKENNLTSALDKIIVQGYKALQLEYFFTAGPDEVKAWTVQKGTKAPQAAGRIHTDFEKGFIMAEVMHFKDFKEEGTEAACKAAGKYRQQGRNYVVEDGDIIFFKFNAGAGLKDAKKK